MDFIKKNFNVSRLKAIDELKNTTNSIQFQMELMKMN